MAITESVHGHKHSWLMQMFGCCHIKVLYVNLGFPRSYLTGTKTYYYFLMFTYYSPFLVVNDSPASLLQKSLTIPSTAQGPQDSEVCLPPSYRSCLLLSPKQSPKRDHKNSSPFWTQLKLDSDQINRWMASQLKKKKERNNVIQHSLEPSEAGFVS